ncbi:MAG TPA: hypothetical protein VFM15_03260 [Gammaproteobacteria bacterium]|nr:hypothetical protein [Gammaproteobacteria bacterium]
MTRPIRLAAFILCALAALTLNACSPSSAPNPNAKKVLAACLAINNAQASKILGHENLIAFKLSGDSSPIKVCEYTDDKGTVYGLIRIQSADKIKDPVADLNADAEQNKALFKNNLKPIEIHPVEGFGPGAFYTDNTTGPDAASVQLRLIQNGYKILTQVNNPKDYASGEKQAAAMARQALENLQNGTAMQVIP